MLYDFRGNLIPRQVSPTESLVTAEALKILRFNFSYSERFARGGHVLFDAQGREIYVSRTKIGDTLHIRRPARFRST